MTDPHVKKLKAVVAEVNDVLYNDWAPTGIVEGTPHDEYETYAMRVVSLLASGANEAALAAYLASAEKSIRGVQGEIGSVLPIAKRLITFQDAARSASL